MEQAQNPQEPSERHQPGGDSLQWQALLQTLASRGISLRLEAGDLRLQAPHGALDADLQRDLRTHKAELLAWLGADLPPMDFSLFFFGLEGESAQPVYELLFAAAEFADARGFKGIWTPERHFHPLGGPFASPSVLAAALAMRTRQLKLRAGSVVLPLRDPIRVAEEWAMVDQLSGGRAELSVATGWHANDFALAAEPFPSHYQQRKRVLQERLQDLLRLWRGEALERYDGMGQRIQVRSYPRPVQPELVVWLTALGNPESFRQAGLQGQHLLTALLDQDIAELAEKISLYRTALQAAGLKPTDRKVAVFMHTYLGPETDRVREQVRAPFKAYLGQTLHLISNLSQSLGLNLDPADFSEADREALLDYAFERYFESRALMGSEQDAAVMVQKLSAAGVDEIACLLDFGLSHAEVMQGLSVLDQLRARCGRTQELPHV